MFSEKQLISLAKTRPEVFGQLYDAHYPRIFGYIYRITGDYTLAGDICGETFLKAFVRIGSFRWKGISISAWFFRIAINELNQYFRKKRYQPVMLSDLPAFEAVAWDNRYGLDRESNQTTADMDRAEEFRLVRQLVLGLPDKYRQVIALRFFEELQVREIAEILGKKEGTIKSLISRGLDKLKKMMEDAATKEGS